MQSLNTLLNEISTSENPISFTNKLGLKSVAFIRNQKNLKVENDTLLNDSLFNEDYSIKDPLLSSILNESNEFSIGDTIYRYTYFYSYKYHISNLETLNSLDTTIFSKLDKGNGVWQNGIYIFRNKIENIDITNQNQKNAKVHVTEQLTGDTRVRGEITNTFVLAYSSLYVYTYYERNKCGWYFFGQCKDRRYREDTADELKQGGWLTYDCIAPGGVTIFSERYRTINKSATNVSKIDFILEYFVSPIAPIRVINKSTDHYARKGQYSAIAYIR